MGKNWESSIRSLGQRRRVWHGIFMSPTRNMEGILTWIGNYVPSAMQRNLIRLRRGWKYWYGITRGTLPISGTMLLLLKKDYFNTLFLTWMGNRRLWVVMISPTLREVWITLHRVGKWLMIIPPAIVQWRMICNKKVMVLIILIIWNMSITQWWWWNMPTHLYCWCTCHYIVVCYKG